MKQYNVYIAGEYKATISAANEVEARRTAHAQLDRAPLTVIEANELAAPECVEYCVAIQAQAPRDVYHWRGKATDETEAEFLATDQYERERGRLDYWVVASVPADEA